MSIAAAIRIASAGQDRVIDHAAAFADRRGEACFVISIVDALPYGGFDDRERANVECNLARIHAANAAPVMQEGADVAQTLLTVGRSFGVGTLFLRSGRVAERLLHLHPPFDLVVVGSE